MPETQQITEIQIDEPVVPALDLTRGPGEEKYGAALGVEHARREESRLDFLERELARLLNIPAPHKEMIEGLGAKRRKQIMTAKVKELRALTRKVDDRWDGPCAPFTVLNFNPVPLKLQGVLADHSVPPAGKGKIIKIPYNGRTFVASYVTLWNAKVWSVTISTESIKGFDEPAIRADYLPTKGIAHQFYSHYVEGAMDALGMGGIVIFDGDIYTIADKKKLEKANGMIRVPRIDQELSTQDTVEYTCDERAFIEDVLASSLRRQKAYAESVIVEGHGFANSQADDIRNQLAPNHHILWHNWAIQMNYKTVPEKWASDQLSDTPDTKAVNCPGCGTRQPTGNPPFCPKCNAPFNAFQSFMAGLPVPDAWLEMYEGEQWEQIVAEKSRRRAKRAQLDGEPKAEKGKAK
jgi:hypothetical protein